MENKKSKTGLHIFIGILIGIIFCIGIGYISYTLDYISINDNSKKEETTKEETKEEKESYSLDFDVNKIVNGTADSYNLVNYNGIINITLDETRKVATLGFNRKTLSKTYSLNWDTTSIIEGTVENKTITFTQGVKDIFFGGIGQDMTGDVILFLMDDGTVEYIPVYQSLSKDGIDNIKSYGTLNGLNDVVKFYSVTAKRSPVGSSISILAQTKDGKIYDLAKILYNVTSNN